MRKKYTDKIKTNYKNGVIVFIVVKQRFWRISSAMFASVFWLMWLIWRFNIWSICVFLLQPQIFRPFVQIGMMTVLSRNILFSKDRYNFVPKSVYSSNLDFNVFLLFENEYFWVNFLSILLLIFYRVTYRNEEKWSLKMCYDKYLFERLYWYLKIIT